MDDTHESAEWRVTPPNPALAAFVEHYVGYRLSGFPAGLHRGLPSKNMTLIISIGPAIDVIAQPDPHDSPATYRAIVAGLHASPATIAHQGHQEGVAVMLSPLGARALLGVPAGALWSTTGELADVIGRAGDDLWERLQHAHEWGDRFAVIDTALASLLGRRSSIAPELTEVWRRLVGSAGTASVSAIAESVGWSRQHLSRSFRSEFGLSPKLAARLVRFDRAVRMLDGPGAPGSLVDVATACGYYDQSHMTNEFVELGGASPTRILEGDVTYLQDDALPLGG